MIFKYIDTYERSMSINTSCKEQMDAIRGKIFRRKSWGAIEHTPLYFTLHIPLLGTPYFAIVIRKVSSKLKRGMVMIMVIHTQPLVKVS